MRAVPALVAAALLAVTGCGISPTDVQDRGATPTITIPPPSKTYFLIKDGKLSLEPADVENDTVDSLLGALFEASEQPLGDRDTALRGFTYDGIEDSVNPVTRDEVPLPRTSTLTVYLRGDGILSKIAMAQIVCTAQQDVVFEQVKIVRENEGRPSKSEGQYTCGELKPTS
ncbi:hypothetical protein ABGB18_27445 [Nonomuraea sp. B12E4]|uniref:hypothetical protein n=1 Tax=Nonomuraea sp. B12E4 TaxID=3153564 RepID=UPI00325F3DD3